MTNPNTIAILLSTYNSGIYLKPLIDSILSQTYKDWTLYIRDDGSQDKTLHQIEQYCSKFKNIVFVPSPNNLGAKGGFEFLMEEIESDYYMFCDHDDVWQSNKIILSYEFIKQFGYDIPIAIGSDLIVTDSSLKIINESLFHYASVDIAWLKKSRDYIYVANPFVGCTMIFNKMARDKSLPFSVNAIMHDWWVAQICNKYGYIDIIDTPTILYRQHENNTIGTKYINPHSLNYWYSKIRNLDNVITNINNIRKMSRENGCGTLLFYTLKIKQLCRKLKMK